MSKRQKRTTDNKKRKSSNSGKQHVSNTTAAKAARTLKLVGDFDERQLSAALKRERAGKAALRT